LTGDPSTEHSLADLFRLSESDFLESLSDSQQLVDRFRLRLTCVDSSIFIEASLSVELLFLDCFFELSAVFNI